MQGCCLPFRVQDASITTADIQMSKFDVEASPRDKTSENRSSAKPSNREKAGSRKQRHVNNIDKTGEVAPDRFGGLQRQLSC